MQSNTLCISDAKTELVPMMSLKAIYENMKANQLAFSDAADFASNYMMNNQINNAKEAMIAINIFKNNNRIFDAVKIIDYLIDKSIPLDTLIFNNILDGCAKSYNSSLASTIFNRMISLDIKPDKISYTSMIKTYANINQWSKAIEIINLMLQDDHVSPDLICYSSAISACAKSGRWKEAVSLLKDMKSRSPKISPDNILYNTVISACSKSGQWNTALTLMKVMRMEKLPLDAFTYSAALCAYDSSERIDVIKDLLNDMVGDKIPLYKQTAPFNAAMSIYSRHNCSNEVLDLYENMKMQGVQPNGITYSILFGFLFRNEQYHKLLDVYKTDIYSNHQLLKSPMSSAIFGYAMRASEKVLQSDFCLKLLESIKTINNALADTSAYNSVISAHGKANGYAAVKSFFIEMVKNKIPRSIQTYNALIRACKTDGNWQRAISLIDEMQMDTNTVKINYTSNEVDLFVSGSSDLQTNLDVLKIENNTQKLSPDTVTYSTAISVCVESKQWSLALDLLLSMEELNITRNIITYNTVIEALQASEETVRAELVYQSALRAGIYNHWASIGAMEENDSLSILNPDFNRLNTNSDSNLASNLINNNHLFPTIMDLHQFPLSVAKAAIMHVLGDMCSERIPIANPLIIITGRGNHIDSRGNRGVLRNQLELFINHIGLLNSPNGLNDTKISTHYNPGRIIVNRESILLWLKKQYDDNEFNQGSGSVHGNLFLQVAFAKYTKPTNVRAVCPFSSAGSHIPNKEL
eukprot:gene4552-6424_t